MLSSKKGDIVLENIGGNGIVTGRGLTRAGPLSSRESVGFVINISVPYQAWAGSMLIKPGGWIFQTRRTEMSVTTTDVKEATCSKCDHTWIVRSKEDMKCPECRRKRSTVESKSKTRCLCIKCHHVWITDWISRKAEDKVCPKCGARDEDKKKAISTDTVTEYTCGSCGDVWISDKFLNKDEEYCKKCGCGREKSMEARIKKDFEKNRVKSYGMSSYRGHPQHWDDDLKEWVPSKEEIDAKIAAGIFKPERPLIAIL
jgi:ssDNA-binding Zn-finger/Zn-ribbon topoisomerase 1